MKTVFMGTPDFAVAILNAVKDAGHEISAVVTQPDRPKGRGKAVAMSDVKVRALELGIPVLQPEHVRNNPEFAEALRAIQPDVIVVAAFGQILPEEILKLPGWDASMSTRPSFRNTAAPRRSSTQSSTGTKSPG